jgi:hypothetical protein
LRACNKIGLTCEYRCWQLEIVVSHLTQSLPDPCRGFVTQSKHSAAGKSALRELFAQP